MSAKERELLTWHKGEKVVHVDADVMLYSCAFAAQKTTWKHPEFKEGEFKDKKQLNDWCLFHGHDKSLAVGTIVAEPFSHAARAAKMLENKIIKTCGADRSILYVSGNHNFRHDLTPDYKANRRLVVKPIHYAEMKKHLLQRPNSIHVHGMEADDALGIAQLSNIKELDSTQWSVIATIDKDLDMIRGQHYNWQKDKLYYQAGGDADLCFYRQLIMGDSTDNIKGIPKKGKVAAEKMLPDGMGTPVLMYRVVRAAYFHHHHQKEINEHKLSWEIADIADEDLNLNAQLLWIMREPKQHWTPPEKNT
jgi:hypothetical protein